MASPKIRFFAALHMFASKSAQSDEGDVGAENGCGMTAVVARPSVQHPRRVPLGGLPAVWCSGGAFALLSTNTQTSWNMYSFVFGLDGAVKLVWYPAGEV